MAGRNPFSRSGRNVGMLHQAGAGKHFYVAPAGSAQMDDWQQLHPVDEDGVVLVHTTFASALTNVVSGRNDVIYVAPGSYDETVSITKGNLTIIGLGGRGAAYIEPTTAGAEGMQISGVDDVTLINLGVAGDDTGDYALNINDVSRFRAYECKFELADGAGTCVLANGTADGQVADALFRDCEFAWAAKGITFDDSAYGYVTQFFVDKCRFHNITTNMLGVNTGGLVKNLELTDCYFDNAEDGTAPTDYILLSDNGNTGIITGNRFATATNATGVLTIGTGLMWVVNATEAGWSTARPA